MQLELAVNELIEQLEKNNFGAEAICLSNKDGVILEKHFTKIDKPRNIYSHSKSYTSLMVGIAIDEGKLSLDTRLSDVFKDELTQEDYQRLYEITLRDCLTMSSGFNKDLLMMEGRSNGEGYPDYFKYIISHPLLTKPGSRFQYSNADTYLCARMVEKVYQRPFLQLIYEKAFKPLEIGTPVWECDYQGHCFGASGLELTIKEMNKIGILYLNKGLWNNKRIVSENWINQCMAPQIKTEGRGWGDYSYQFWQNPKDYGFRCDGAHGQFTFIIDKLGYALSIQRNEEPECFDQYFALLKEFFDKLD